MLEKLSLLKNSLQRDIELKNDNKNTIKLLLELGDIDLICNYIKYASNYTLQDLQILIDYCKNNINSNNIKSIDNLIEVLKNAPRIISHEFEVDIIQLENIKKKYLGNNLNYHL